VICLKAAAREHWQYHFTDAAPFITTGPGLSSPQAGRRQLDRAMAAQAVRQQLQSLPFSAEATDAISTYLQDHLRPVSSVARITIDHPDGIALIREYLQANDSH